MLKLARVAQALGLSEWDQNIQISDISTDTRTIQPGSLFVALTGERFDGAEFVAQAAQAGAAAALVNRTSLAKCQHEVARGFPLLTVENTRLALGRLASWWRQQFELPLVAITGSNGKTTVKEMLVSILQQAAGCADAVLATRGNLNNDIGMPLTLLRMNERHRYAVIEMGMNHAGEIEYLTQLARPQVALVNNAGKAHLQGLGSVTEVARAKGEIFSGLTDNGTAIINADDPHAALWENQVGTYELMEFGTDPEADIYGQVQQVSGLQQQLFVETPQGSMQIELQVPGQHNACNALAAIAAAVALNIPLQTVVTGLEQFQGVPGRLQLKSASHGATVIDDCYNANPDSMMAALQVLAQCQGERMLVLGDMGELGAEAAQLHADMGLQARRLGIDRLLATGTLAQQAAQAFGQEGRYFEDKAALIQYLQSQLHDEMTILIKGSRFMQMETVVQACMEENSSCC